MTWRARWIGACTAALLPAWASAGQTPKSFTLGRFVPADVWMSIQEVHNPERDFICRHWERVMNAAAKSGLDEEVKNLISENLQEEQRAGFQTKWDSVRDALKGVPWDEIGKVESVFAQRIAMPMPNYLMLCRNEADRSGPIADSLANLLKTAAALCDECTVVESQRGSAKVWALVVRDAGPILKLFVRDDIVGAALGRDLAEEVLDLMDGGDKAGKRLVDDPTYQRAVASVESPEDGLYYFRMGRLFDQIRDSVLVGLKKAENDPDVSLVKDVFLKAISNFDFIDYVIVSRETKGLQDFERSVTKLAPDSRDKPMVKAITGRKMFDRFDRFVPEDATGFFCSTLADVGLIYDAVLDFIKTEIPTGPAMMEKWEALQEEFGFNPKRDVFSWLSGEVMWVSLPGMMGSQFNGALFIRTKDPKLAAEKINGWIDQLATAFEQVKVNPAPEVEAEGFRSVFHPMMMMMQTKPVIGFYEDWLVIGTKPQDVNRCLATAKGNAPSIRSNPRFMKEGLDIQGEVNSASFSDMSHMGEELGMAFGMMGMVAGMIPDQPETKPVRTVFSLMARLAPVVAEINFYSSTASVSRFTGEGWTGETVTTYKSPEAVAVNKDAPVETPH